MDEERMARMMSDPNVQQTMNEALSNPDFVNMLIESNPMLRNMPNARELITSPFMRSMMSNPAMLSNAMRMQRGMQGGDAAFPAPGATDTTPADGAASTNSTEGQGQAQQNPFMNPFMNPFGAGAAGGAGGMSIADMMQSMNAAGFGTGAGAAGAGAGTGAATQNQARGETGTGADASATGAGAGTGAGTGTGAGANPFAALFPGMGAGMGAGMGGGAAGNPFGMTPEQMQQMSQMMRSMTGGDAGAAAAPPDNRPPEERFQEQLRQLNDMGFVDFDQNVAALRRSGGSVQGALEFLLM